jgi:hypothetical protein
MNARMPRRTFYGIVVAILVGMIAGLLEIIYDLVCDSDPTAATSPFGSA